MAYISLADGLQAVYDGVISVLGRNNPESELKYRLLESAVDIIGRHSRDGTSLKLARSIEIFPLLSNLLDMKKYQKVVRQFLVEFMDCKCKTLWLLLGTESFLGCALVMEGHTDRVDAVGFSPDSQRVISGSYDNTIRIWDAETGNSVGKPFRGHL